MFYVALVLVSTWSPHRRITLRGDAGCSIMTPLGFILPPSGLTIWFSAANRTLVLASILLAVEIVHLQKRAEGALQQTARTTGRVEDEAGGSALSLVVMKCEDSFMRAVSKTSNQA